jgi:hypothetical protein
MKIIRYLILIFLVLQSCTGYNTKRINSFEVNGIIDSTFIDRNDHLVLKVELKDNYVFQLDSWKRLNSNIDYYIEKGDSIVKRKGEYSLFVYKPNGKVKEFKYMDGKGKVYSNKE